MKHFFAGVALVATATLLIALLVHESKEQHLDTMLTTVASDAHHLEFMHFIQTQVKQYRTFDEYKYRLSVFSENKRKIDAHNSRKGVSF